MKKRICQGLSFGIWNLGFVWNLVLGAWNLSLTIPFPAVYRVPSTDCFRTPVMRDA
jgi:hypothetical protein